MGKRVHIAIVEPSPIIRCGILTILQDSAMPNTTVIDSADLSTILSQKHLETPDILIINPSYLGLFTPSQLRADIDNIELIIVALQSVFVEQSNLHNYDEVISIYDTVESIRDKVLELTKDRSEQRGKKEISLREKEIIVCVVKGMTNKQIAETLNLSTHTVIAHRRNIANKLQIHSPSGLTIYAIVNKLVNLTDIKNSIAKSSEE